MRLEFPVRKSEYIEALRKHMGSVADVGRQRFTGAFWGSFFYIAHHCTWEWNRKISGERCSALGFVTATEDGCRVRYLKFPGASDPKSWIKFFLIFLVLALLKGWDSSKPVFWPLILGGTAFCAILSSVSNLFTTNGWLGEERLKDLLRDPISFEKTE